MSVAPYPEYKDTISILLGAVPAHWTIIQMKRFAPLIYGDALPTTDRAIDGSVPVYGSNGPVGTHDTANTGAPVIIIGRKGSYGAVNWSPEPAFVIDTAYFIDEARARCDLRWLYWAYQAAGLNSFSQDTGVPGLARELVHEMIFVLPSMTEQSAIAAFLDQETGKIDALVAEQERLIALLKEKRQAVISQAVTKGLNPNAPMKDSGIEWLGQVPAHWEVGRLSQFCTGISTGPFGTALGSQDYVTDGVPVINPSHIINGRCVPASDVTVSTETAERLSIWTLAAGDIITARRGELGRAAVVGEAEAGWICGTGSLRLRPKGNLSLSQFLFRVFECRYTREWLELSSVGSTMANINEVIMGGLPIALPLSDAEREQISLYVDYESSKIDALIIDATQAITLLRERRAALISAAVTGKIDVRSLALTKQEAA